VSADLPKSTVIGRGNHDTRTVKVGHDQAIRGRIRTASCIPSRGGQKEEGRRLTWWQRDEVRAADDLHGND